MTPTKNRLAKVARVMARLGGCVSTDPVETTVRLLSEALSMLADAAEGGHALAQVTELEEGTRLLRQQRSADDTLGFSIVDAVTGELKSLLRSTDESRRVAGDALLGSGAQTGSEDLAALIHRSMIQRPSRRPEELRKDIAAWILERLPELPGEGRVEVAGALADDLLAALMAEPSVQAVVDADFRALVTASLGAVQDRLANLEELAPNLRELTNALAQLTGRPMPCHFDELCAYNRPAVSATIRRRLRDHLCKPLGESHLVPLFERHGIPAEQRALSVPSWFCYVPHTLEISDPWDLPARGVAAESVDARQGADARWLLTTVEDIRARAAEPRNLPYLLLVEAKAGFGKSTFVHHLAATLAEDPWFLPVPPLELSREEALPLGRERLKQWAVGQLQQPPTWMNRILFENVVGELVESGRAVLFIDGLDQVAGANSTLAREVQGAARPWRVVAACRQELRAAEEVRGWSAVLRLGAPDEATFSALVPSELREVLRDCFASLGERSQLVRGDDTRNPFLLHVVRILGVARALPTSGLRTVELLRRYVEELFALAAEKPLKRVAGRERLKLGLAEWTALGILGLTSLRLSPGTSEAKEQRLGADGLDEAKRLVRSAFESSSGDRQAAETILDDAATDAHLFYLVDRVFLAGDEQYVFHHQLLQEFLAAKGIAQAMNSEAGDPQRAVERLCGLVGDIVQPRLRKRRVWSRGGEVPDRVRTLSLWGFVADLLAADESELDVAEPEELCRLLTARLWDEGRGADDLSGSCRSALLRLRDELLEREDVEETAAPSEGQRGDPPRGAEAPGRATTSQDPFVVILGRDEEQELAKQWKSWVDGLGRGLEGILPKAWKWRARKDAPSYRAEAEDELGRMWSLVPPGGFLAGSWETTQESPVRMKQADRPFWMARDPVTVKQYGAFLNAHDAKTWEHVRDKPWWKRFRNEAVAAFKRERQPLEEWSWQQGRGEGDNPVSGVSWFEAAAYCLWLNWKDQGEADPEARPAPLGPYRLPTEAEWEKAARGVFARRWPWGCAWRPGLVVCAEHGAAARAFSDVESNPNLSPFDVQGLAGNVWEWTSAQWNHSDFGQDLWSEEGLASIGGSTLCVVRGGSFFGDRRVVRCACRDWFIAGDDFLLGGFRCVRDVDAP